MTLISGHISGFLFLWAKTFPARTRTRKRREQSPERERERTVCSRVIDFSIAHLTLIRSRRASWKFRSSNERERRTQKQIILAKIRFHSFSERVCVRHNCTGVLVLALCLCPCLFRAISFERPLREMEKSCQKFSAGNVRIVCVHFVFKLCPRERESTRKSAFSLSLSLTN